MIYILFS